ncbi:MAG: SUMF1/EgtB/PvdO family nonheme iron enzyme [Chlamydiales bacterium]
MQKEIIGDYKIIKQIGQGPLGSVLLAEHRFIKKPYVLKVLPRELCQDRNFMQHFEQEVSRFAPLEHPHLVRIHNISFSEGIYFLVTDCVVDSIGETTNLAQYMSGRKERLREEELLSVARQVADVLDFVHSKGVVHGCLTLNNILIGKGTPGIDVFISDLGLLKLIHPGAVLARTFQAMTEALELFPAESEKGLSKERYSPTPIDGGKLSKLAHAFLQGYAFLAPEQKVKTKLEPSVDIYAYGVLMYYLITGIFPEGIFEMPSKLAPDYRTDWDSIVKSCLQANPQERATQLRPLLERRKIQTISVEAQPHVYSDFKQEEIQPRPFFELKREEPCTVDAIKEELIPDEVVPPVVRKVEEKLLVATNEVREPLFTPQLHFSSPQDTPAVSQNSTIVDKKDFSEATVEFIMPEEDPQYSTMLSSMLQRDPVVTQYQPEKKVSTIIEPIQTEMVVVSPGEYMRGSNEGNRDEAPRHKVQLDGFAIDIHPVTNEQFVRFIDYMGGEKDQNYNDLIRLKESRLNRTGGRVSIESGYARHPVVGVTWYGAVAYAKWVGKRLPTEAEWEIAARGGRDNNHYSTGANIEKNQANFFSSDATTVMSYAPNPFGIYDISGNVYEWCQDWYGYNYYETSVQEPHNPKGPLQGVYRVLRGGCWKSLKEDMRCSHRHRNNPGTMNGTYGFRCASDLK